ncbi:hypothetical protein EJ02DRAFT_499002 [Clathrospora elynae]|uniref:BTB domain-containing protein n=1 Tax=Clathrospora elynae TaxID=706981 RepID=A0A6A5T813_9PLEO|nr:hypothetical protein EJ02DRAFT_499002 [Clathrospora elynae]
MDDLSFLDTDGASNATLKVVLAGGQVCHISDRICPFSFLYKCPLLYHTFEYGTKGRLQASIEATSRSAVVSLLRYCYTDGYLPTSAETGPPLLLQHVETYKIAEDLHVPELQLLANGILQSKIDTACYLPTPPEDLHDTIRFVYRHYSHQQPRAHHCLINTLVDFCISVYIYHSLGENEEFLKLASELPDFRQDLCRTNYARNFKDECACEIIQLSLDTLRDHTSGKLTIPAPKHVSQWTMFKVLPDAPNEPQRDPVTSEMAAPTEETHEKTCYTDLVDSFTTSLVHRRLQQVKNVDSEAAILIYGSFADAMVARDEMKKKTAQENLVDSIISTVVDRSLQQITDVDHEAGMFSDVSVTEAMEAVVDEPHEETAHENLVDLVTTTVVDSPPIPQPGTVADFDIDASSDEDGFSIIIHPPPSAFFTPDGHMFSPMSSPGLVSSAPVDSMTAVYTEYLDDEWTLLD